MKNMMLALLGAGLGLAGVATAYNSCQSDSCTPCCQPCCQPCCGSFEVIGEALLMRPSTCDMNYAIFDPNGPFDVNPPFFINTLPDGKEHGICPDYQWGFRVGVGYVTACGNDARVVFSRLKTSDHSHVRAPLEDQGIWITFANPTFTNNVLFSGDFDDDDIVAFADSRVKTEWNAVDAEVGMRKTMHCDFHLRGHVGLHYADIHVRRDAHYEGLYNFIQTFIAVPQSTDVASNYHTWGIGPRLGLDARYDIGCGFGIAAHAGVGILAGESKNRTFEEDVGFFFDPLKIDNFETLDVFHRSHCIVFPELDASLGVTYLFNCGKCFSLLAELGYEFRSYINSVRHTTFTGNSTNFEACDSFNLDGLYLSFTLAI